MGGILGASKLGPPNVSELYTNSSKLLKNLRLSEAGLLVLPPDCVREGLVLEGAEVSFQLSLLFRRPVSDSIDSSPRIWAE